MDPSPDSLSSHQIVFLEGRQCSPGLFQNANLSLPLAEAQGDLFSHLHHENLVGLLEVKLMKL